MVGNVEPLQQNGRIALRRVPVLVSDNAFELAQTHTVAVGQRGLGIEPFAFFERAPQTRVAHDDRVEHAEAVKRELVLAQHAELGRCGHGALLRQDVAGEQAHERGLAGTVGAGQAVPAARGKGGRDFVEEHLRRKPHGDVLDSNHWMKT